MTGQRPPTSAIDRLGNLSAQQVAAVVCLVATGSTAEAAHAAGRDERTVRRWLSDRDFSGAYRALAREAATQATSALLSAQRHAVAALVSGLDAPSHATRVRAARALLEVGRHALDDDTADRLDELEREVSSWQNRGGLSIA